MGENHGCGLTTRGRLICWGVPTAYPKPEQAKGRFLSVAAGDDHTCAIRANRTLVCWGNNENGELNVPAGKFRQVVARGDHSCGVTQDKRLLCWGEEAFTNYSQTIQSSVKKVATGQLHTCALGLDGLAKCWGNGIHGENKAPVDRFTDIVAGDWHTCGLRADYTAVCWGRDQYGQTQVGMDKYRLIAGGGMQTCGILRDSRHLACHGSFANNEIWYPNDEEAKEKAYEGDGVVRPQLAFLAIFQGLSGLLSSGITDTGKMVDKWHDPKSKWEARSVPIQLVGLITNMFLGWFMPKDNTMTQMYDLLKDIQADIRRVEKGLDEVKMQLNRTELAVLTSWCDSRLEPYAKAYDLLAGDAYGSTTGARSAYIKLLKKQEEVLTQSINQRKISSFPIQEFERFKKHYIAQLKTARQLLHSALTGANQVQTPAIKACFEQGYAEWKSSRSNGNTYPFDDRGIYEKVYKVLRGALIMQGEILQIEQDIEMQEIYSKLREDRADNAPPIDFNPYNNALGLCLYADERKATNHAEYSPRWVEVAGICQENRDRIQNAYINMIEQVEVAGGAYSDDQVVLSLTSKQMGLPDAGDTNWLWMRNIPDQDWSINRNDVHGSITGKWMDFHHRADTSPFVFMPPFDAKSDAGTYYMNKGNWNVVEKVYSFNQGVWHSNGESWLDLFKFCEASRKQYSIDSKEDVLEGMSQLKDMTSLPCKRDSASKCLTKKDVMGKEQIIPGERLPLFTGVASRPFWILGAEYEFDVRYKSECGYDSKSNPTNNMLCFAAEGINKNGNYHPDGSSDRWEDLNLSGKVCSSQEMAAMTIRANDAGYVGGINCNGDGWCVGIGMDSLQRKEYDPYKSALGGFFASAETRGNDFFSWYYKWTWHTNDFKAHKGKDGNLYHMPVVKISDRKCKSKMTGGNRDAFRLAGGVQIPSICGEDMDRLIKQVIPRPEYPPVPEALVRLPEAD